MACARCAQPCARTPFRDPYCCSNTSVSSPVEAQLHTCVVYAQRFAVSRYDTTEAANELAILLEISVPSLCVDLLAEGGNRAVLVRVAWPADGGRFASRWHLTVGRSILRLSARGAPSPPAAARGGRLALRQRHRQPQPRIRLGRVR